MRALLLLVLAFAAPMVAQSNSRPQHFSDAELETIFAYALSMPPIKNRAPEPLPQG